jgi:hypothetical protein
MVLDRRGGAAPRLEPIPLAEAIEILLEPMPSYGAEVRARYETVLRALPVPAYRLTYENLDEAVHILREMKHF